VSEQESANEPEQPFEFDADTAVRPLEGPGRYGADLTDRWNVGGGMNGGYLAAVGLRAALAESPHPDPLTMTVHYLARPAVGQTEVRVETVRVGRGHAWFRFDLVQGAPSEVLATGLLTTGRRREPGPLDFSPPMPPASPPDSSSAIRRVDGPESQAPLFQRIETRIAKADDIFFLRSGPGEAATGGWTRLADGRGSDALVVPLFLDCWPPAIFSRTMQADSTGAPTIELTIHWRRAVPPGWLLARFHTKSLGGGYIDEHGELWSEDGLFVAESRQLARYGGGGPPLLLG
jgi:acyl-coenzyme A thioesterase PaaI-like protein